METVLVFLPYVQIFFSVLLVIGVVLMHSSTGLGGAFSESGNYGTVRYTRRGFEKILFNSTIIIAILFVVSGILSLIYKV